jgi:hypothetical protein
MSRGALITAAVLLALPGAAALAADPPGATPVKDASGAVVGVRVPGYLAYAHPDREALKIGPGEGTPGWSDPKTALLWYGEWNATGALRPSLRLRLPVGERVRLRLTVGGARPVEAEAVGGADGSAVEVAFPEVNVTKTGYARLLLEGVRRSGATFGNVEELRVAGPAAKGARFPWTHHRSAASVHLGYPLPEGIGPVTAFYTEVMAREDPITTYYCAAGWRRGYFGYQVNGPKERRVIFSVWDAGGEPVDPNKVKTEDRVQLLAKGPGVYADRFGNEGTGGHSHLVYPWKTGGTYRFLVTAAPDGPGHAVYSGYFFFPERKGWGLIARFRAPLRPASTDAAPNPDAHLRGLYAFDEDFWGAHGDRRRLAEFGRQWVRTADGRWHELTEARFTHTGRETMARTDFDAGPTGDGSAFFLATGGFVAPRAPLAYGDKLKRRPSAGGPPADLKALLANPPSR